MERNGHGASDSLPLPKWDEAGAFWSASSHFGKGKKIGSAVAKALMRFISGIAFGMALSYVVNGFTGNVQGGWIEAMADGISSGAK